MKSVIFMGGLVSDEDSVQFELATDMEQLNFTRGRMAGEADGNSLFITSATSGDAKLFDQYNDFLTWRKTEYLVIDDGATSNEVFELVTGRRFHQHLGKRNLRCQEHWREHQRP